VLRGRSRCVMPRHDHGRLLGGRRRRRRSQGRRGRCPQRPRLAVGLVALVTLRLPLLRKLLRLRSKTVVIPIDRLTGLVDINTPPLRADIDATGDANPGTKVTAILGAILLVDTAKMSRGRLPPGSRTRRASQGFCRRRDHVCPADSICRRLVRLLEVLGIKLKRVETVLVDNLAHAVDNSLGGHMLFTPDSC
jgi:hypothetical protein